MITIYLAGIVATMILCAIRAPYTDLRDATQIALFWPISLLAILVVMSMDYFGYNIDVILVKKLFGFRRPTTSLASPGTKGFALTVFYVEIQIWKATFR